MIIVAFLKITKCDDKPKQKRKGLGYKSPPLPYIYSLQCSGLNAFSPALYILNKKIIYFQGKRYKTLPLSVDQLLTHYRYQLRDLTLNMPSTYYHHTLH